MKSKKVIKKILAISMCVSMTLFNGAPLIGQNILSSVVMATENEYTQENATFLVFENNSITSQGLENGYSIDNTTLTISSSGNYVVSGECSNGSIYIAKDSGEVNLILNGITLTSTDEGVTAINSKGGTTVLNIIVQDGTVNNLSDADHGAVSPKSCINASQDVVIKGNGTLNVVGNNKNGIKTDTNLTIEDNVVLNVTAVDNGIAADEKLTISGGNITVNSTGDGIRSCPDVLAEDGTNGNVIIENGVINVTATQDGIQADNELIIYNGTFNIKTNSGYQTTLSDSSDSCKGIKASNKITVYGGTYNINSADDAIHSNGYIFLLGGNYEIYTGDDGAHADTSLYIGNEDGGCPVINIKYSYEGLEAGTVYIYSGDVDVVASDDGINSAGGSSNGSDTGTGGPSDGGFNPGGGSGTGPGGRTNTTQTSTTTSDYSLNIYNGDVYVNAGGDGLDSNGDINITGGKVIVFGAASNGSGSDNSALDYDGTCLVTGGILLACGSKSAPGTIVPSSGSQSYIYKTTTINANSYINVCDASGNVVMSVLSPKQVNHEVYSPATSSYTITTTSSSSYSCSHSSTNTISQHDATCENMGYSGDKYCTECNALIEQGYWTEALGHTWDDGVVTLEPTETTEGTITYTCTVCNATKEEKIEPTEEVKYEVTFNTDDNATIDIYYTQDYTQADEENVEIAYARSSTTGEIDATGDGQVNFVVNVKDGYEIESVTADGNYKNLKDMTDTMDGLYRLTKVTGDVTVTVTTKEIESEQEPSETGILKGDLNRDGLVNADDAAIALDLYKYNNATEEDLEIGDMNGDELINADDAALILDVYKYGY